MSAGKRDRSPRGVRLTDEGAGAPGGLGRGGNVLKDAGGMTFPPGKGDFHSHIVEGGEW